MPRSASKSRADKDKSNTSNQETPTQDLAVEDVKPVRLTQAQWMDISSQEDTDEAVAEVMEDLMTKVTEGCLKVYTEKQLIPFTASWAVSYLAQAVEQQVLYLDPGDGSEDASQTEDSEPVPTAPESCAPGCMPVVNVATQPSSQQEVDIGQLPAQTSPEVKQKCSAVAQTHNPPLESEKETSPRKPLISKRYEVPHLCPVPKVEQKKKQQRNLPPRPVQSKLLPPLSCSAEKMDVNVKHRNVRPASNLTSGSLYQHKDPRPIPKLDPSCLPRHRIVPQCEFLDIDYTKPNAKKPRGLSKLEWRHKKQLTQGTVTSLKPLISSKDQSRRRNEAGKGLEKSSPSRRTGHSMEGFVSSGPLRLDEMELAEGVALLNLQAVDTNSLEVEPPFLSAKMRPIQSDKVVPLYSIDEITGGPPPRVTPLFPSKSEDK